MQLRGGCIDIVSPTTFPQLIGYRLGLSQSYVSRLLRDAMRKLGVKTQAQLVQRMANGAAKRRRIAVPVDFCVCTALQSVNNYVWTDRCIQRTLLSACGLVCVRTRW